MNGRICLTWWQFALCLVAFQLAEAFGRALVR